MWIVYSRDFSAISTSFFRGLAVSTPLPIVYLLGVNVICVSKVLGLELGTLPLFHAVLNASTAVLVSNDLKLNSDSAVLGFGADNDITLTHAADTGLTTTKHPKDQVPRLKQQ